VSSRVVGSVVVVGETPKPSRSPIRAPSDFHLLCLSCIRHSRSTLSVPSPLWSPLWSPRNSTQLHFKPTPTGSWFLVLGSRCQPLRTHPLVEEIGASILPSCTLAGTLVDAGASCPPPRAFFDIPPISSRALLYYPPYPAPRRTSIWQVKAHSRVEPSWAITRAAQLPSPLEKGPATLPTGLRSHGPSRIRSRAVTHARIPRGAANISVSR
jgi:hypothetical protein